MRFLVLLMALKSGRWKISEKVSFLTIVKKISNKLDAVIKRATSGSRVELILFGYN